MKKIKNVVFDFGQVLIHFDPLYMTKQYIKDENQAKRAADVIFDRLYWDKLDAGTITDEETLSAIQKRLPNELHEDAALVYKNWIYNIPEFDGMRALMQKIKAEKGVRIFILSNISRYFADHSHEIEILKEAEKCIFSSVCGHIKPNLDMFAYLCDYCQIRAEETLFIDDNEKNVEGARACGMQAYQFDGDVASLEKHLINEL